MSEEEGIVVVKLQHPVEHGKNTYTEIRLRTDVTVEDLEAMDSAKGGIAKTIRLICAMADGGLAREVVRKMKPVDYFELAKAANGILGDPLSGEDGETS